MPANTPIGMEMAAHQPLQQSADQGVVSATAGDEGRHSSLRMRPQLASDTARTPLEITEYSTQSKGTTATTH